MVSQGGIGRKYFSTFIPCTVLALISGHTGNWQNISMDKKYSRFIFFGVLLYVVYHVATLIYSPIPWFDEETYANITESFLKNGHFYEEARNISVATSKLDLAYGPVYFMLQGAVTTLFGFSIFTFRMTNLFFGLGCLFLIYKVCRQLKFSDQVTLITLLLIGLDPQFNQFLHSGRMDFIALFFFLSSYLVFTSINSSGTNKYLLKGLLTGILMACAFLTNPRILFSFSFYPFFFLFELISGKFKNALPLILKYAAVVVSFVCLYGIWVYVEFGSLANYISETYTNSPIMKEHVGATTAGLRLNYNMIMHILSLVCFLLLLITGKIRQQISVVLLTVPAVIVFLLLVSGGIAGRYYGLVVPFTTILIVGSTLAAFGNLPSKIFVRALAGLFFVVFVFKAVYIFATMDQRNPATYDKIISATIPDGSSVGGDFQYYYIGRKHGWKFQCLEQNGTKLEEVSYFQDHKYDYFVIEKNNNFQALYQSTFLKDKYKLVATIDENTYNSLFHRIIARLPYKITEGYACYIYKYTGG